MVVAASRNQNSHNEMHTSRPFGSPQDQPEMNGPLGGGPFIEGALMRPSRVPAWPDGGR